MAIEKSKGKSVRVSGLRERDGWIHLGEEVFPTSESASIEASELSYEIQQYYEEGKGNSTININGVIIKLDSFIAIRVTTEPSF